ncbi:hypothetical protein BH20ACI3_BH20ACI3_18390 [soil metagenome]
MSGLCRGLQIRERIWNSGEILYKVSTLQFRGQRLASRCILQKQLFCWPTPGKYLEKSGRVSGIETSILDFGRITVPA